MKTQDILRKQVKITKANNDDWTFKSMSEVLNITSHSFYNWLKGYYDFSYKKVQELQELLSNLNE